MIDKTIMEQLDEIVAMTKELEVMCKDLQDSAWSVLPIKNLDQLMK